MEDEKKRPESVRDDVVVTMEYTLWVDGNILDTSEGGEAIMFVQGAGQLIPGLEENLYGLKVGESRNVTVSPDKGYGEIDEDAVAEVPLDEFPPNLQLQKGMALQLRDDEGNVVDAYVMDVGRTNVRLNFNHPLAGKELDFKVTVVNLRDATEEELEHGHVHQEGPHDEDFEEEDWDEEEDFDDFDDDDWEDFEEEVEEEIDEVEAELEDSDELGEEWDDLEEEVEEDWDDLEVEVEEEWDDLEEEADEEWDELEESWEDLEDDDFDDDDWDDDEDR